MAALLERELGQPVTITPGRRGEFTVWVDQREVATKTIDGFPDDAECLEAVQDALALAADER